MDEYILVGKTKKTYGVKGAVKLQVEDKFLDDVAQATVAFLKIQGKFLPYFIEYFDFTNSLIVKFEGIDSPEKAVSVASKELYVYKKDIKKVVEELPSEKLIYAQFEGFTIHDVGLGEIGEIIEIHEFPQQEMAEVHFNNKEILIPLNKSLISSVDMENQKIIMQLPDGLLDL